jgi:hypothetical protein
MWWVSGITVVFVLALVGVGVLGRSATARWERQERAARARRRPPPATTETRPGTAERLRDAVVRAAAPVAGAVRTPLSASARVLDRARRIARRRTRTVVRTRVGPVAARGRRLVPRVRQALHAAAAGTGESLRRHTAEVRRPGRRWRRRRAGRPRVEPPAGGTPHAPSAPSLHDEPADGILDEPAG